MLFKIVLLLLTVVVPGIAQNNFSSLFIEGSIPYITDCANLTLSTNIQLKIDHQNNILTGCEKHQIQPNISMKFDFISICTLGCVHLTNTTKIFPAIDIPILFLQYNFCNISNHRSRRLWNNFALSILGSNFFASNNTGSFISIANCSVGSTKIENLNFCKSETGDIDCDFQMSTVTSASPTPKLSTTSTLTSTSTANPTLITHFSSRTYPTTTLMTTTKLPTTKTSQTTTEPTTALSSHFSSTAYPTTTLMTTTTEPTTALMTTTNASLSRSTESSSSTTFSTLSTTIESTITTSSASTLFTNPTVSSTIKSTKTTISPATTTSTSTNIPSTTSTTSLTTKMSSTTSTSLIASTTTFQLISTSPTNNLTPNNSFPGSTTTSLPSTLSPQSTPFVPLQNPYDINCTNPDSDLDAIYCHVESTNYTAAEISNIINNTINAVNITKLTPKEVFAVVGIFRRCSEINDLTHQAFNDMSKLVDTMLEAPSESYIQTHKAGIKTTQIILDSVNRVILNSPSNVSYLNGKNVALLGKVLDCQNNNNGGDAEGLSDFGNGFSRNVASKAQASISIDGNVACEGKAHRVFYTIYRNSKFFIGSNSNNNNYFFLNFAAAETTTTTSESSETNQKCNPTIFGTDDSILSGNVITNNSISPSFSSFIHSVSKEGINQNIVTIKFDKKHIGVFLHGKIGIRWWDITTNSWSSETCKVEEIDGYYVSKCTHLTDFTLLVDGIKTDPILCDKVLEIVNYIVSIGSMFSLLVLNVIYIIILIPPLSQKIFSNIFLKIVPKSDKNIAAFIYSFLLFLFFFIFTLFTNQDQVVIKTGCYIVAALNYWLLMTCIILSLFQSWKIVKMFVWNSKLEKIFHLMTMKKIIYPIAFTFSSLMTLLFGIFTQGDFFKRNDSFCWIRPDYLIAAVIIPLTILSINAILTIFIMSFRLFPHLTISKLIRTSSTKINKISNKEARERAFVLFLVQFTLGVPWLLQYFTLFEPKATAWHFLFVIVNGSQGIIILISFIYRCYGTYKSYNLQKRLWA